MRQVDITIIGAGLSGLYAASLLEQHGITDYVLIEARNAVGGRIASATVANDGINRFDLGPTWYWPAYQPELDLLVRHLGLSSFEQYSVGDMVLERSLREGPLRTRGYVNSPTSMRLTGGMQTLTDALLSSIDQNKLMTGQTVRRISYGDKGVEVDYDDAAGQAATLRTSHVLLALPPRLAEASIEFTPELPTTLAEQWRETATWMAPHAKYIAVYPSAFWREDGLSGEARSATGPLTEIHDASMPGYDAALFGFIGISAEDRKHISEEDLIAHCREQLVRMFGANAAEPKAEFLKDWAIDPYTATAVDSSGQGAHAEAPPSMANSGYWQGRLTGIASEWSLKFPGYLAGAIDATGKGVRALLMQCR